MLKKKLNLLAGISLFLSLLVSNADADVITLHVPILEDSPQHHIYYHELLETAIREAGHIPAFITRELPQLRIKDYLNQGKISIYWLIESAERNKQYIPIEVGITDGLIGKRILLIKRGDQHLYDNVKNLDDFRNLNLVGGFGNKWFEVNVWKTNNLRYIEQGGNWKAIFKKISKGRDFNYFPSGSNEVLSHSRQYPELDIEKRLVLIFDRDFRFYLSRTGVNAGAKYKDVLEDALKKAKNSGLIDRLVRKYWAKDFKTLNYDKRIKIHLKTPE